MKNKKAVMNTIGTVLEGTVIAANGTKLLLDAVGLVMDCYASGKQNNQRRDYPRRDER